MTDTPKDGGPAFPICESVIAAVDGSRGTAMNERISAMMRALHEAGLNLVGKDRYYVHDEKVGEPFQEGGCTLRIRAVCYVDSFTLLTTEVQESDGTWVPAKDSSP